MNARGGRNRRGARSGVFQLNSGATTFGRGSVLPLNAPGGSFMSGRPAGGGGGDSIAQALAAQQPTQGNSVTGSPEIGPPPAPFMPNPPEAHEAFPAPPTFTAPAVQPALTPAQSTVFPRFQPIVQPAITPAIRRQWF